MFGGSGGNSGVFIFGGVVCLGYDLENNFDSFNFFKMVKKFK